MTFNPERVISVSLDESDWHTLLRVRPQPVIWLREVIEAELARAKNDKAGQERSAGALEAVR